VQSFSLPGYNRRIFETVVGVESVRKRAEGLVCEPQQKRSRTYATSLVDLSIRYELERMGCMAPGAKSCTPRYGLMEWGSRDCGTVRPFNKSQHERQATPIILTRPTCLCGPQDTRDVDDPFFARMEETTSVSTSIQKSFHRHDEVFTCGSKVCSRRRGIQELTIDD
jgi:hypothetical protein